MNVGVRRQLLRALYRDAAFLKAVHLSLTPEDFPEMEERVIAKAALDFYEKYNQSIGPLLGDHTDELAKAEKFGVEQKQKLIDLRDMLQNGKMEGVSVRALEDRVWRLKEHTFYDNALEEIIKAYEGRTLDSTLLSDIVERSHTELRANGFKSTDYLEGIDSRIERRRTRDETLVYPRLMLGPLDDRIHGIGRGELGVALAPPAGGKGLFLAHLDTAYAFQGYNVLHLTLEDPRELVEDRLDASLSGLALKRLPNLPNKFKRKHQEKAKRLTGRIRIIDGTDEGWTVSQIERAWEYERQKGFIADVIVIDYDDEIVCERQFKGESARRFEFSEIYKRLRALARRTNAIVWTAAQTTRKAETRKIVTGKDVAEDYSKIRKVFLAIGIGSSKEEEDVRYLHVLKHRHDEGRFYVKIKSDYKSGIFYDINATNKMVIENARKRRAQEEE